MDKNMKIQGFRKFSQLSEKKEELDPVELSDGNLTPDEIPMNPNLPEETKKEEVPASTKELKEPRKSKVNENVKRIGKIAKFPRNSKASTAYNYLEDIKISKKSIWYLMIEKQDNELQMVKYNNKEGVNLAQFVSELKSFYIDTYKGNKEVCEQINKISIGGNDKFTTITNIPLIQVGGKKIISKITEDLIRLLSK
jgi:hypothetical protein|tara:strand:+ start:51235 stop:51822 length:588 start_codon:yes stop_codon:yes gene_type:complete